MKKPLLIVAALVAAGALATLLALGIRGSRAAGAVAAEIERLRASGEPLDPAAHLPPAPADPRDAARLGEALRALGDDLDGDFGVRSEVPPNPDQVARRKDAAAKYAAGLQSLHEALARPRLRLIPDYSRVPVAQELRGALDRAMTLFLIAARERSEAGDVRGAVQCGIDLIRLASTLEEEPVSMLQSRRRDLVSEGLALLKDQALAPEQEADVAAISSGPAPQETLRRMLRYDRSHYIRIYLDAAEGRGTEGAELITTAGRQRFLDHLKTAERAIDAAGRGLPELWAVAAEWARFASEAVDSGAADVVAFVDMELAVVAEARAWIDLLKLGAAVKSDALPPDAPLDPFTGKPYGFRREAGTVTLWSAGRDRKDDGGDPRRDSVWRVKR